ncbi:MAG: alpha-glucan family phosphorylase [Thermotogota bacterium]|nr:alpha-glucan family phosphorylase [Thermotogota bacterium]
MRFLESIRAIPKLPKRLERLEELAYNFWWTWNPSAEAVFKRMDIDLWYELKRSPVKLLRRISQKKLNELAKNEDFLELYDSVLEKFDRYIKSEDTWIKRNYPEKNAHKIAYFCAEYGIHESFPIYSGGLGVLAGDHLKTASDMGFNLVAVGLLYRNGYFSQLLDKNGWQQNIYQTYDFEDLPVKEVNDEDGEEIVVTIQFPERKVYAKVWKAEIGRVPLYLLDTDIYKNTQDDRKITKQLYGGDRETRIKQEIVLGIGGVRALRMLGHNPSVWHMNEGHAAFLGIERIREYMIGKNLYFKSAIEAARSSNVFTTHTPVPAGNDVFDPILIDKYFSEFWVNLGITRRDFMELGSEKVTSGYEHFSMTVLALRLSACANGVSLLHGKVSRKMWNHIFPDLPEIEIPIDHITNGVHLWTWLNRDLYALLDRYFPDNWEEQITDPKIWENVDKIPDKELWNVHCKLKQRLRKFSQGRLKRQRERLGETVEELAEVKNILPENALTIGFARRFATYKRSTLVLKDIDRLKRLLTDPEKPVQFIYSGKAHPADDPGKELIKRLYEISRLPEFKNRIVFVENYDTNIARHMVSGVDVWLNTPRRPHEASGTSGEKAGMNGVLNFSVLDGWWVEGYNGNNGWVIGDNRDYDDKELQDRIDSVSIYNTLENEIIPTYYKRNDNGIPESWVKKMKNSIKSVGKSFNTHRMLADYAEKLYFKTVETADYVKDNDYEKAKELAEWKERLEGNWKNIRIKPNKITPYSEESIKVGTKLRLTANVYLGELKPDEVQVEIFLAIFDEDSKMSDYKLYPMKLQKNDVHNEYIYSGEFTIEQEARIAYTIRVVPNTEYLPFRKYFSMAKWVN